MGFLKELVFEKDNFEKNQQATKNMKFNAVGKGLID